jgi:hypothetical protein
MREIDPPPIEVGSGQVTWCHVLSRESDAGNASLYASADGVQAM